MDLSSNRVPENGSQPIESVSVVTPAAASQTQKRGLNAFDLVKVGLSSTFAIAIFFVVGYVVKHVAGPSTILSILLAAFIAYLVGKIDLFSPIFFAVFLKHKIVILCKIVQLFFYRFNQFFSFETGAFYTELNTAIVLSAIKSTESLSRVTVTPSIQTINDRPNAKSKPSISTEFLLPSYTLAYVVGNGEFAAFIIAWNLIMEYIVIVALISKVLIIFIDALCFGSVGHLTQIIPMAWQFSQYFDVMALLVPIVIGGKLCYNRIYNQMAFVFTFSIFEKI